MMSAPETVEMIREPRPIALPMPLMKSPKARKTRENPRAKNAVRPMTFSQGAAARFIS